MTTPAIIYLHGFLSSPQSAKARLVGDYLAIQPVAIDYSVPSLPEEPARALAAAEQALLAQRALNNGPVALIGSSMGGFYATILAQRYNLRAVLINPSVAPQRRIHEYFGAQQNPYSGRRFVLDASDADELAKMAPRPCHTPDNFWLLVQRGDEVLDYREAVQFYAGCKQTVEPGGDHQFQGFERYLPDAIDFLLR
jgi:uncharacterized protein